MVYFVMFIKLIFRQGNIAYVSISSLLIVKTNNLSGGDSYIVIYFVSCVTVQIVGFFSWWQGYLFDLLDIYRIYL